ncbi:MAG: FAD-dependent oxidoreductase [Desulfobacterota bacterium]|jgi:succinate dehydrogenase/fumarate reductase flavoprotein subunit|nr:FAD-dependent oxidoreductase [Thermodesulfobacteriota bacterium]
MKLQDSQADVLIIGAGLAGMMAAWAAGQEGARVLLLDRSSLGMGTNSALSNAVLAAPTAAYPPEQYVRDTWEIGRRINRKSWVSRVAQEAPGAIERLLACGLEAQSSRDTYAILSPDPRAIPGVHLVRRVADRVKQAEHLHIDTGFYVTEILVEEGRAAGVQGLDTRGQETRLSAGAVILAAGGAGAVYHRNDNQKSTLGQGYALAARAGLALWDMEFVQFFPLVLAEPRLPSLILYPPLPREVRLVDARGQDLSFIHGAGSLGEAIMEKRDEFSAALYERLETAGPVFLDFRSVPASWWDRHPLKGMTRLAFDFRRTPVAIAPAAHFFMGGVRIDGQGETDLPGLFACGEMVWGLHGANRRGGNALTECLVSGWLAGSSAARRSGGQRTSAPATESLLPKYAPVSSLESIGKFRKRLKAAAWGKAGVVRTAEGLRTGLAEIGELEQGLADLQASNPQEKIWLHDLRGATMAVRAVLTAGLNRKESRGSFIRKDFPEEDNGRWLKNSCLTWQPRSREFITTYADAES